MARWTAFISLVCLAEAQFGGLSGPSGVDGGNWNGYNPGSNGGDSAGSGFGQQGGPEYAERIFGRSHIVAHGVLACLAMVIFFPFGAISIRVLPPKLSLYLHVACQILGYVIFIAAFGIGVWMARQINFSRVKLIDQYHPVIGIIVFSLLSLQPILGVLHHGLFKKYKRRIINGGLGLRFADNASVGAKVVYGVIAGLVWIAWIAAAIFGEVKQLRKSRDPPAYSGRSTPDKAEKDKKRRTRYYA